MSIEYKNIKVLRKTGKNGDYKYEGTVDVHKKIFPFPAIITKTTFWYEPRFHKYGFVGFLKKQNPSEAFLEILNQGGKIKSEDECCISPDRELCGEYPLHDIILCHILDNYEVVDYCFKKTDENRFMCGGTELFYEPRHRGYIKFKYDEHTYSYDVWLERSVKEYACLSCRTCDRSEEEAAIRDFKRWFKEEVKRQERKDIARGICCEEGV